MPCCTERKGSFPTRCTAIRTHAGCDPAFARGLRRICDEKHAVLILDEVRTGFRMSFGGSWEQYGVRPDLSSWSKAIGNGY
ncbi:MAG TPA: aminotransferase class III-fold pyridoxal phosphate-dependent enzyme, partial [Mycobacterium sp.]|nr:aminotransferase class III-fold pyridoxal phosphate-dependent enzyme [Mycobacterium sp.]